MTFCVMQERDMHINGCFFRGAIGLRGKIRQHEEYGGEGLGGAAQGPPLAPEMSDSREPARRQSKKKKRKKEEEKRRNEEKS